LAFKNINDGYINTAFSNNGDHIIDLRTIGVKNPLRGSKEITAYDDAVNAYIHKTFGKPNILDVLKLRFNTGLNPHIYPSFKLAYNKTPKIEAEMLTSHGSYPHPDKVDLPVETIEQMFKELGSKPLLIK